MTTHSKIRVGVLRGGPSREYDVSLKSGANVLKHMPDRYIPVDIFIDKSGTWHYNGVAQSPARIFCKIDLIFNALHGAYGEDGTLPALLDAFGLPYTGSSRIESALSMHKGYTKDILKRHGVKSPYHKLLKRNEVPKDGLHALWKTVLNPSIVKPVASGSSIGVTVVENFLSFEEALIKAFDGSDTVLIEEYITGREATCGVLDNFRNSSTYALLPAEVLPTAGAKFFDYAAKYAERSQVIHPGRFSPMEKEAIQKAAQTVHETLGLSHYSRSDFIISPTRGIYFLEVNSLPGLYAGAPFVESLTAVGSSLSEFIEHVVEMAREGR